MTKTRQEILDQQIESALHLVEYLHTLKDHPNVDQKDLQRCIKKAERKLSLLQDGKDPAAAEEHDRQQFSWNLRRFLVHKATRLPGYFSTDLIESVVSTLSDNLTFTGRAYGDYIDDILNDAAESCIQVYSSDLHKWLAEERDSEGQMMDVVREGLVDVSSNYSFFKHVQAAQFNWLQELVNEVYLTEDFHALLVWDYVYRNFDLCLTFEDVFDIEKVVDELPSNFPGYKLGDLREVIEEAIKDSDTWLSVLIGSDDEEE